VNLAWLAPVYEDSCRSARRCCGRCSLLPVVGWALDGLYLVATHSGGTLAPALGELVAGEVIGQRELPALAPLRPGRFGPSST
jgi:glycine/D-amino acid oxidase-like deaminating enzyme